MTAAAPPRPSTSTARLRSRDRLVEHPPLPTSAALFCDRCGRYRRIRLADWLCAPCRRGAR